MLIEPHLQLIYLSLVDELQKVVNVVMFDKGDLNGSVPILGNFLNQEVKVDLVFFLGEVTKQVLVAGLILLLLLRHSCSM